MLIVLQQKVVMIKKISNLDPSCNVDLREKATNTMCGFVSQVYLALNLLSH